MSKVSMIESLDSTGISRPFYTGGEVQVGAISGYIFSLYNGGVSVVDPSTGQTFAHISVESDPISTFAVNPSNNFELVTVGQSLLLRHWSVLSTGEVSMLRSWNSNHLHTVSCLAISFDGSFVATSGIDKCIRVFSLTGYFVVVQYRLGVDVSSDPISVMRFHPSEYWLVSNSGPDNLLHVWDVSDTSIQSPVFSLSGHMSTVHSVSFSPDGKNLISSGNDQVVLTFDVRNNFALVSQVAVFESVHSVLGLNGGRFVTVGDKGLVRVWNNDRKLLVSVPSGHAAGGVLRFVFACGAAKLLTVGSDLAMSIWNFARLDDLQFERQLVGSLGEIVSIKYLSESRAVIAVNDEFPRIMDLNTFGSVERLIGHTDIVLSVAVSKHGLIATGSKDQTIRIWQPEAGNTHTSCIQLTGHTDSVTSVCFTNTNSTNIGLISGSEDTCVKMWKTSSTGSSKIVRSIVAHSKGVNSVSVSRNDAFVASSSQDRTAKVFNLADGSLVGVCLGHKRGVWAVEFSPIEQIVATCSGDGTVKLWNLSVAGLPCIRTFEGHEHAVLSCKFLPSGLQLVSADAVGIMRVWNIRNGECDVVALADGETILQSKGFKKNAAKIKDAEESSSGRIWAFDLFTESSSIELVTGTSAGVLSVWRDSTSERVESRKLEIADQAAKDTSINVLIAARKFNEAFQFAFELNRPKQMLEIVKTASWTSGEVNLRTFVANCTDLPKLSKYVGEWQKSTRNCSLAYNIVSIASLENVDGFEGFAEKHLNRLENLAQKCFVIDAILIAANTEKKRAESEVSAHTENKNNID